MPSNSSFASTRSSREEPGLSIEYTITYDDGYRADLSSAEAQKLEDLLYKHIKGTNPLQGGYNIPTINISSIVFDQFRPGLSFAQFAFLDYLQHVRLVPEDLVWMLRLHVQRLFLDCYDGEMEKAKRVKLNLDTLIDKKLAESCKKDGEKQGDRVKIKLILQSLADIVIFIDSKSPERSNDTIVERAKIFNAREFMQEIDKDVKDLKKHYGCGPRQAFLEDGNRWPLLVGADPRTQTSESTQRQKVRSEESRSGSSQVRCKADRKELKRGKKKKEKAEMMKGKKNSATKTASKSSGKKKSKKQVSPDSSELSNGSSTDSDDFDSDE